MRSQPSRSEVPDTYRWLEDGGSTETQQWIARQQALYSHHLADWSATSTLSDRITNWLDRDEWSVPRRRGDREFATRLAPGNDHPQLIVTVAGLNRVLVDPITEGGETCALDAWEPSPSGQLVGVQFSSRGVERGVLTVRTVDDGTLVDGPIGGVRYSPMAWIEDAGFFYVRTAESSGPGTFRRRGVWFHHLGRPTSDDDLVFEPARGQATVVDVSLHHCRWLVISESYGSGHRNDLWIGDLSHNGVTTPNLVAIQQDVDAVTKVQVSLEGHLYLMTTLDAPRRRLCEAEALNSDLGDWNTLIPQDSESNLSDFIVIHSDGVVKELLILRSNLGFAHLHVYNLDGTHSRQIELPGFGRVQDLTAEPELGAHLVYAGVNHPATTYCYEIGASTITPTRPTSPLDVAPEIHHLQDTYRSIDGTLVPIAILSTTPLPSPSPQATILHAYGSFGEERQFGFSATVLAWLEAGGQYAVAYVRGGGDGGRHWHHQAVRRAKGTAVDDLTSAADWLVAQGHTTRHQLCLSGSSAGGLLMLAAVTRRPDVAGAAIASAPLADMVRFEQLGLGVLWTAEFGTATDASDLEALLSYSPYHNIRGNEQYPAVLLTGFHQDTRASAAHPRKMTAALQAATGSDRPILLRYETDVGHGRKPRGRAIALAAEVHGFAAARTGLSPQDSTRSPLATTKERR